MRNKKKMAIGILCVALIFMGIGYSLFSSTLNISGTSKAYGTFNVQITDVDVNDKSTGATDVTTSPGYTEHEANLSATFNAPGDYITYDIEVSNLGTIDALISVEANGLEDEENYFKMSCNAANRTELDVGEDTTFQCTIIFDEDRELTGLTGQSTRNINPKLKRLTNPVANLTVTVEAEQKSTYQIEYVDQDPEESCFVSVIPGEINYYDTSKQGCGTTVTIPNDLRLKTTTVESSTFNNQMCLAFAPEIKEDDSITDQQFCDGMNQEIQQMSTSQLFNSMYSAFVTPTFGTATGDYNVIDTIGAGVFAAKNLTSVSMSTNENITEIGDAAFIANSLQSIVLPPNIQTIGTGAFVSNQLSGSLTLPSRLISIGGTAFYGNQLGAVDLSNANSLQTIEDAAFAENNISGTITIPSHVTNISYSAFALNQISALNLTNATSLETIGETAFYGNQISGTVTIPSSVTSIGSAAFNGNKIETLNIGSGLTSLGYYAFNDNSDTTLHQDTLTTINIDMTQATWNSRNLPTSNWYDGSPTVTYNQS